jgi:DNA (cytosine-5)-methyltransferase 1
MLQPNELAAAQGFPSGYDFAGTKGDKVKQIGNAVPVGLAKALALEALSA